MQMANFAANPAVLLHMILYLDMPTLLNFRLLNRSTYDLVSAYERSITMKVKESAWHTVPKIEPAYLSVSTIRDLARLNIARQLAVQAVKSEQVVDRTAAYFHFYGFEPDDAMANDMRDSVTKGFMLVYQLHQIQTEVVKEFLSRRDTVADRTRNQLITQPTKLHKAKEQALQQRWQEYWNTLSASDLVDFRLMTKTLRGKLLFDHVMKISLLRIRTSQIISGETESSVSQRFVGHLLREGPALIKRYWRQDPAVGPTAIQRFGRTMKRRPRSTKAIEEETNGRLFVSRAYPPPRNIYYARDTAEEASGCYAALFFRRKNTLSSDMLRNQQLNIRQRALVSWRIHKMRHL